MPKPSPANFKLSPCWFCEGHGDDLRLLCRDGSTPFNYNESEWNTPKRDATVNVSCLGCQCEGPLADFDETIKADVLMTKEDWDFLREKAVKLWNTRKIPFSPGPDEITRMRELLNHPENYTNRETQEANPSNFTYRAKIGTGPSTKVWVHPGDLLVIGARIRFRDIQDRKPFYQDDEWNTGVFEKYIDGDMLMIGRM